MPNTTIQDRMQPQSLNPPLEMAIAHISLASIPAIWPYEERPRPALDLMAYWTWPKSLAFSCSRKHLWAIPGNQTAIAPTIILGVLVTIIFNVTY